MRHRLRPLDAPDKADDLRAQQRITIGYGQLRPHNYIRLPLPVFNGQKHRAASRARTLAHGHQPGKTQPPAIAMLANDMTELPAGPCQRRCQQIQRMGF